MTPMKVLGTLIATAALAAVVAPAANAATVRIDGHVIAPPGAKGKRTAVPLLLSTRSERKLKLRRGIVRVLLRPRARLSAPGPNGRGAIRLAPSALQAGDRVRAVAKLSRKRVKRLRKRAMPAFAVRRVSVVARASALSNEDLARMIAQLDARLTALSGRVDALATSTAAGMAGLRADLDAIGLRTAALEGAFGSLSGSLTTLLVRIDELEDMVDPTLLAALRDDVDSLLLQVAGLDDLSEGLSSSLATLGGTVGGLEGSLATTQGQIGMLTTTVGSLGSRMTEAEDVIEDVPGVVSQIAALDDDLLSLTGRMGVAETQLEDVEDEVTDLTGDVLALDGTTATLLGSIDELGADVGALEAELDDTVSDLGGLASDLSGVESQLESLDDVVTTLDDTVDDLGTSVGNLGSQVGALTGAVCTVLPLSPICP